MFNEKEISVKSEKRRAIRFIVFGIVLILVGLGVYVTCYAGTGDSNNKDESSLTANTREMYKTEYKLNSDINYKFKDGSVDVTVKNIKVEDGLLCMEYVCTNTSDKSVWLKHKIAVYNSDNEYEYADLYVADKVDENEANDGISLEAGNSITFKACVSVDNFDRYDINIVSDNVVTRLKQKKKAG